MPCDRTLKPKQTIQERATEIRAVVDRLVKGLVNGSIKAKVGPQGAIAFDGLSEAQRDGVTDACIFRRVLSSGSPLALQAIQRAEMLAGRKIDRQQVAVGAHAHSDGQGGLVWHSHKG